ncbi:hypothetical protein ACVIGB_001068 [Bradyrhizobium sp. USDA 4341]
MNRRILVILLPLDRSDKEVADLAKIFVAMLRVAANRHSLRLDEAAGAMGNSGQDGTATVVRDRREVPPLVVGFDGFEHYASIGMAEIARAGRVLNTCFVFGCDPVERMVPRDQEAAKAILAACANRIEFVNGEEDMAILMRSDAGRVVRVRTVLEGNLDNLVLNLNQTV